MVEFGNLIAGPYAAMLLADLGADVIKVEPPEGDLGRTFGPEIQGESAFFLAHNRGKRSVVLDLHVAPDRERAVQLCSRSDVVISNLRGGSLERYGLDHASIASVNPGIVYAIISAFGADGPYADRAGIDIVFQAESGMISITGEEGGPTGKTATTIADYVGGTNAAMAICAALVERADTGKGRQIEVSLRDGLMAVQGGWNAIAFAGSERQTRVGTGSPFLAPNQIFATSEGELALAIVSDRHFAILADVLSRPDLLEKFSTNAERMERLPVLTAALGDEFIKHPATEWVELLGAAGLPVGQVLTLPEVWGDPQVLHNRMVVEYDHPNGGRFRAIGSPIRSAGQPLLTTRRPPRLGEHTDLV